MVERIHLRGAGERLHQFAAVGVVTLQDVRLVEEVQTRQLLVDRAADQLRAVDVEVKAG